MIFKLSNLNERQYDYVLEVLKGCIIDTLDTCISHDRKLNEIDDAESSLSRNDAQKLLEKINKILGVEE